MSERGQRFQTVLDGYPDFLRDKKLELPKHQRCLLRWVREFLGFAAEHSGYTVEQTLDLPASCSLHKGPGLGVSGITLQQTSDGRARVEQDGAG